MAPLKTNLAALTLQRAKIATHLKIGNFPTASVSVFRCLFFSSVLIQRKICQDEGLHAKYHQVPPLHNQPPCHGTAFG
jgi:hypothetical protein